MQMQQLQEMLLMEIAGNRQRTDTIQLQMKTLDEQAKLIQDLGEKLKRKQQNEKFLIGVCNQNRVDISRIPYPSTLPANQAQRGATLKKPKPAEKLQKPKPVPKPANLLEKYTYQSYAAPSGQLVTMTQVAKNGPATMAKSTSSAPQSAKPVVNIKRSASLSLPSESPVFKTSPLRTATISKPLEKPVEKITSSIKATVSAPKAPLIESIFSASPSTVTPVVPQTFMKPADPVPRYGPQFNAQLAKSFEANGGRQSPQLNAQLAKSFEANGGRQSFQLNAQLAKSFEANGGRQSPQFYVPKPVQSASVNSSAKVMLSKPTISGTPFSKPAVSPMNNGFLAQKSHYANLNKNSTTPSQPSPKGPLQTLNATPTNESPSPAKLKVPVTPIPVRSDCILWGTFIRNNFSASSQMPKKQKLRVRGVVLSFLEMKGYTLKDVLMYDEKQKINDVAIPEMFVEECFDFVVDRLKLNKPKYVLDEEDLRQLNEGGDAKRRRKDVDYDLHKMEKLNSLK
jgi:hypothetical protein